MPLQIKIEQDPLLLRRDAYPEAGEQLGALVKFVRAVLPMLPAEVQAAVPEDVTAIIAAVDEVKAAFPKSEGPADE